MSLLSSLPSLASQCCESYSGFEFTGRQAIDKELEQELERELLVRQIWGTERNCRSPGAKERQERELLTI